MKHLVQWVSLVLAVASVVACDGQAEPDAGPPDSGPPDAGPMDAGPDAAMCSEFTPQYCTQYPMSPVPMASICEIFADMFCTANERCCNRPEETYATHAACVSDQTSRCVDPTQPYELTDGLMNLRLDYNTAAMGERRAVVGSLSYDCVPVHFPSAIFEIMEGRVESGGECAATAECVDGYRCLEGVCRLNLMEGQICAGHADCAPSDLQCASGTCATRLAVGESCTEDEECESLVCVDGACAEQDGGAFYCVRQSAPGRAFER